MEHTQKTGIDIVLGEAAIGTIEPAGRQLDQAKLAEMHERLNGNAFYAYVSVFIPNVCIDGRFSEKLGPNAAGGTMTLVVADQLTTNRFRQPGEDSAQHLAHMIDHLQANGYEVGGHRDEYADGVKCGCGACDKLSGILKFIALNGDALRGTLSKFGVQVPDEVHDMILGNASKSIDEGYANDGAEIANVFIDKAGEQSVPVLPGEHFEVEAKVNMRSGTTLDRGALRREFGNELQAFNVDAWAFYPAAEVISADQGEARAKEAAMYYYNFAAACVLGGPTLRVSDRK